MGLVLPQRQAQALCARRARDLAGRSGGGRRQRAGLLRWPGQAGALRLLSLYFLTFPQRKRIMAGLGAAKHPGR